MGAKLEKFKNQRCQFVVFTRCSLLRSFTDSSILAFSDCFSEEKNAPGTLLLLFFFIDANEPLHYTELLLTF